MDIAWNVNRQCYVVTAYLEISVGGKSFEIEAKIDFRSSPGRPATRNDPAEDASIEFYNAVAKLGDKPVTLPNSVYETWLDENDYDIYEALDDRANVE